MKIYLRVLIHFTAVQAHAIKCGVWIVSTFTTQFSKVIRSIEMVNNKRHHEFH